jgi:hypothetical protein
MWILYEKRIDKFLKEKHLGITCHHTRPQVNNIQNYILIIK